MHPTIPVRSAGPAYLGGFIAIPIITDVAVGLSVDARVAFAAFASQVLAVIGIAVAARLNHPARDDQAKTEQGAM